MKPNLLMRSWMMAHVYGAEYQAVVCHAGSDGEVAFRESLCPQYTFERHDAKGLCTYHITGTCGGSEKAVNRKTNPFKMFSLSAVRMCKTTSYNM